MPSWDEVYISGYSVTMEGFVPNGIFGVVINNVCSAPDHRDAEFLTRPAPPNHLRGAKQLDDCHQVLQHSCGQQTWVPRSSL